MMIYSQAIFNSTWQQLLSLYDEPEAKSMARWLLEDLWEVSMTDILINKPITDQHQSTLEAHLDKLLQGIPIQYVLGYAWFLDRKFIVSSEVLIPRQETEELVDLILSEHSALDGHLLDIGTGSGIIPISIKIARPQATVYGLDVSKSALHVAKTNAQELKANVHWLELDILTQTWESPVDLIVSNPPYVLENDKKSMHKNVLDHDPALALFVPDSDPLLFYRRICELSHEGLKEGGRIYFEIHEAYGQEVCDLMRSHQLSDVTVRQDLNGKDRIVYGTKKAV